MEATELSYLAGIIDGEGSISLSTRQRKYVTPTLQVTNTDKRLIDWLLTRGGTAYARRDERLTRKPSWLWRMAGREARETIRSVRPYLRIKDRQADIVLSLTPRNPLTARQSNGRMVPSMTAADFTLITTAVQSIRALNRRGATSDSLVSSR